MSIKSLLMPLVTQRLFSRERLLSQRAKAERRRMSAGLPHAVHYFHQADDPYSAMAAACLKDLQSRYAITLIPHVVSPPEAAAAPERDRLVAYSRKDAQLLADHFGLPYQDPGQQPAPEQVNEANRQLVAAIEDGVFTATAEAASQQLWQVSSNGQLSTSLPDARLASSEATLHHLQASDTLRTQWGHYLGATFYYGGEWYWGVDRLYHLEQRLQDLGVQKAGVQGYLFPPSDDLSVDTPLQNAPAIDFFFSLRSPYSAIVARRVFDLGRRTVAPVRLRFLLPMVMRGLPVPKAKRQYIAHDAAREAHVRGIPFGRLNDPVGRPTERGLALIPLAEKLGLGEAYLVSFMQGVWAQGLDAGSERGLRTMAERAGLSWADAQAALKDEAWRATAEANREAMFALGLWGVPSFQVGDTAVWGQDRLWAVQDALVARARLA
jgi:2-hydroxychromene-2-carboxylate isomerase